MEETLLGRDPDIAEDIQVKQCEQEIEAALKPSTVVPCSNLRLVS